MSEFEIKHDTVKTKTHFKKTDSRKLITQHERVKQKFLFKSFVAVGEQ